MSYTTYDICHGIMYILYETRIGMLSRICKLYIKYKLSTIYLLKIKNESIKNNNINIYIYMCMCV